MKIAFAIKAMGIKGGGAERVLASVASGLAARGHEVSVLSSDGPGAQPFYSLDRRVRLIGLGVGEVTRAASVVDTARRMAAYRRAVRELAPDVAVGFMHSTYLPLGLALAGLRVPLVASEHTSPEHYEARPLQQKLLALTPLLAARTTVVSEQVRDSFGWWLRRAMTVLPNPVSVAGQVRPVRPEVRPGGRRVLLSVGGLSPQKNHRCLIDAFAQLARGHAEWTLRIVGEGALRGALEAQVRHLGLGGRVELPGAVADVAAEYAGADLFVMPSSYESLGLATAEALLSGLPAVGFADCPGTNSLIRHDVNGLLVEGRDRTGALAHALDALMRDAARRERLAGAPTEWLTRMFDLDAVVARWESLLEEVARAAAR